MSEIKESSPRNKTIQLSEENRAACLGRCVEVSAVGRHNYLNSTVYGDLFAAAKRLPEGVVDLLIADPPYNLNKNFGGNRFYEKSSAEYLDYTEAWLDAVLPVLKDTASVYVCCDVFSSAAIFEVLSKRLTVRNRLTWQREKGRGAKQNWKNGMEDIWFATVSDAYTFNLDAVKVRRRVLAPYKADGIPKDWAESDGQKYRDTCPSNFWDDVTVPYWSMSENTVHPTQKPEKLIAKLILASSNAGDTVFDPFLGSGTTSVTAKKLNRNYVGIEQNPDYCALCAHRLTLAETDKRIQGFDGKVFYERNYRE